VFAFFSVKIPPISEELSRVWKVNALAQAAVFTFTGFYGIFSKGKVRVPRFGSAQRFFVFLGFLRLSIK
jgi:hypothetical protein